MDKKDKRPKFDEGDEHRYLRTLLKNLFPERGGRTNVPDRRDVSPRSMTSRGEQVVAHTSEERRAVAVAALLAAQAADHGASNLSTEALLRVAEEAMTSFEWDDRAAITEEVFAILDWMANHLSRPINVNDNRNDYEGDVRKTRAELRKAISENRDVMVEYFSFHRSEWSHRRISPRKLTRDFLVGFCHMRGDERRFRLTRIRKLEQVERPDGQSAKSEKAEGHSES